jgi:eukaryotic-like serine/threonine-protein kinase
MPEWTAEQIAQTAFDRDLIDERHLRELWGELGSQQVDPAQFQQLLVRRELVTNYQLKRLLRGDRYGYFYGPYKILYKVGAGTFARVYRAVHRETSQVRAVKVLRAELHVDKEKREAFIREGEMGRSLKHPNIVPIYEVDSDTHGSWIVMEFIEGRNLREFLKSRPLEPQEAIRLSIDICRGLDYAFQRGVSHRDLKTSNVLISVVARQGDSVGQAKLLDFGLAGADPAASDDELEKIENPRTVDYAALERSTGVRKDDSRSDIFFFGCMLYHMLSGKPALEETRDRFSRMSKQRFEDMLPLTQVMPDLPKDVAAIVMKATKLDPELRYQTPAEMLGDLVAVHERLMGGGNGSYAELGKPVARQRSLMIVEPNTQNQDALRAHFKERGFRVLVTADAERPGSLFTDTHQPADCVIFSSLSLGEAALQAFNDFGDQPATHSVPAVLLLSAKHNDWVARAKTSEHRATVLSPLKMKRILELLDRLTSAKT